MISEERRKKLDALRKDLGDFPIIREKTMQLIETIVDARKPNMVLELGSGKGFSGVTILSSSEKTNLLTVEKDKDNYQDAMRAYAEFEFFNRVLPVNADAEDIVNSLSSASRVQKFDLIFLDCNKTSYNRMFDKVVDLLEDGGVLIADDVLYHGMVENEPEVPAKKHRTIVVNLREFIEKAKTDARLENVVLYDFEDGVLVATKKASSNKKESEKPNEDQSTN